MGIYCLSLNLNKYLFSLNVFTKVFLNFWPPVGIPYGFAPVQVCPTVVSKIPDIGQCCSEGCNFRTESKRKYFNDWAICWQEKWCNHLWSMRSNQYLGLGNSPKDVFSFKLHCVKHWNFRFFFFGSKCVKSLAIFFQSFFCQFIMVKKLWFGTLIQEDNVWILQAILWVLVG